MTITAKVQRVLDAEQIPVEELITMVQKSARLRGEDCNKRYYQWAFRVNGTVVEDMRHVTPLQIGHGSNRMLEEHEPCNGEGCHACGWCGHVSRAVEDATALSLHP